MNKIALTFSLILGISCLLPAQESEAPKVFRDSTKNRYTLYPTTPKTDPTSSISEGTPTNIDIDTIVTEEVKSPATTPALTESGLPVLPETQSRVSESGLPIVPVSSERIESETIQTPVSESGLPIFPETQSRVSESGLPIAPVSSERSEMTEKGSLQTPVSESGLPVISETRGIESATQDTPVSVERSSVVPESVITQPLVQESPPAPDSRTNSTGLQNQPTQIPTASTRSTERQTAENKVQTSSDGPIRDWSNPPGFTGYSSNAKYKTKKHVLRKNKHKYRPHQKYQRKKTIRSPRF